MRQNRPDDFFGAVASAAPVDLFGSDLQAEGAYNWNIWARKASETQRGIGLTAVVAEQRLSRPVS
jgi:hypothetical protein